MSAVQEVVRKCQHTDEVDVAEHTEKGTLQNKNTNENKKKELDNIE